MMKKKVMLSICGRQSYQDQDPEVIELVTEGTLEYRDNGWDIQYEESDLTGMEDHTANELHVIMAHTHDTGRSFAHDGENFAKHVVKAAFAALHGFAYLSQLFGKLFVGELLHGRFKGVYLPHIGAQGTQVAFVAGTEYFADQKLDHRYLQKKTLERSRE